MTTTAFITVCGSVSDSKWAGLESYAHATSYAVDPYLTQSVITVNACQGARRRKKQRKNKESMGRPSWCRIEIHQAAGSLICWRTPSVEQEWNLFPCLQPFPPAKEFLCLFFPLQIISASKKKKQKKGLHSKTIMQKKKKKMFSTKSVSTRLLFFPSPKPFCLGFHLVCQTLNVLGCVAWWDLLNCISVCMAQSCRLWGGNYKLEMLGTLRNLSPQELAVTATQNNVMPPNLHNARLDGGTRNVPNHVPLFSV